MSSRPCVGRVISLERSVRLELCIFSASVIDVTSGPSAFSTTSLDRVSEHSLKTRGFRVAARSVPIDLLMNRQSVWQSECVPLLFVDRTLLSSRGMVPRSGPEGGGQMSVAGDRNRSPAVGWPSEESGP